MPAVYIKSARARDALVLQSVLSSLPLDYFARLKVATNHLTQGILESLPIPTITRVDEFAKLIGVPKFVDKNALELIYTSSDLQPFAVDIGYLGLPFQWEEGRRFVLRSELDAFYFHVYCLSREDAGYIIDTFPTMRRRDERQLGEYRTKRVILEIYDAMAEAARTGIPYQSRLSLAHANASVAHSRPEKLLQVALVSQDPFIRLADLPDGAWATPAGVAPDNVAFFSLIDVLRAIGEPVDSEKVRFAAILVRKPALATALMEDEQANDWLRAIGTDARPLKGNVVQVSQFQRNGVDYPWAEAIKQLRGSGALVVDSAGKWSAGTKLPPSSGQDWVIGRVAIAVQLISTIAPERLEQKVVAFIRSVEDGTARRAVS